MLRATDNDSESALKLNHSKNSINIIFSCLNINSIKNKFDNVRAALFNYDNIFTVAETMINESFPTAQFAINDFYKSFGIDITNKSVGLLVYLGHTYVYII